MSRYKSVFGHLAAKLPSVHVACPMSSIRMPLYLDTVTLFLNGDCRKQPLQAQILLHISKQKLIYLLSYDCDFYVAYPFNLE